MTRSRPALSASLRFYAIALGVVAVDQITKIIARNSLAVDRPVRVIPGIFDLRLSYNTGAAFGVLPDWTPLFVLVALIAIYAIVRMRRTDGGSGATSVGLGLLLGGAVGNLVDRLLSPSRGVTDFLDFHISLQGRTHAWPTFNIADVAIVIGAIIVLFSVYVVERRRTAT